MGRPLSAAALLLSLASLAAAQHGLENPSAAQTYDEYYIDGVNAYSESKWKDAIPFFRHAVEDYNRVADARLKCFAKCTEGDAATAKDYSVSAELALFFIVVRRATCIERCREDFVGARVASATPSFIEQKMLSKEAYNYLQLSLYQEGKVREAAKACATFSYHNPFNLHVKSNVQFYTTHPNVSEEDMKPDLSLPYRDLHNEGNRLYHLHHWKEMTPIFEAALLEFYKSWEGCRTLCGGPLRYAHDMDLAQAMSKLYATVLECRTKCVLRMGKWRYDSSENFFGSFFHYIQHGYYNMDNPQAAAQASATHMRVEPASEVAKRNAVFYRQQEGISRKDFVPREDALPFIEKMETELEILQLLEKVSGHVTSKTEAGEGQQDDDESLLELDFQRFPVGSRNLELEDVEPVVVQLTNESGAERLVMDQVITQKQCDLLIELASHGSEGDGYHRKAPHTTFEKFEGLHILEAAKKASEGEVNKTLSKLYVDASARVKELVAQHFKLQTPLYFSYTHLVCRTALEGQQKGREDLSHPVHSDNCVLDEALGECLKVPPAYTWRDYSAILYLNGDIEGGRFFFAHSPKDRTPEEYVDPQCGRAVGFSAGKENMHGVTAVTKGRRCAVALWFTLDPQHREGSFEIAENIINGITTA